MKNKRKEMANMSAQHLHRMTTYVEIAVLSGIQAIGSDINFGVF